MGIQKPDWNKIQSIVMEIHDIENRLNNTVQLLKKYGFKKYSNREGKGTKRN